MKTEEGKRLKLFMERQNLSQEDIANLIGKQQPDVSKYISGVLKVPLTAVKTLHVKAGLSYNWFFHGTGEMKTTQKDKRNLINDITELSGTISLLLKNQEAMRDQINRIEAELKTKNRG